MCDPDVSCISLDCAFDAHAACNVHDAAMDLYIGLLASLQLKKRS